MMEAQRTPAGHDLPVSGRARNGQDAVRQILQADLFGEIALAKGERFDESEALPPSSIEEEYK